MRCSTASSADGHALDRRVFDQRCRRAALVMSRTDPSGRREGAAGAVEQPVSSSKASVRDEQGTLHATYHLLAGDHGHVGGVPAFDGDGAARTQVVELRWWRRLEVGELHVGEHHVPIVGEGPAQETST